MNDVSFDSSKTQKRNKVIFAALALLCYLVLAFSATSDTLNIAWINQYEHVETVAVLSAIVLVLVLGCTVLVLLLRLQSLQAAQHVDSHAALHDPLTGAANRRQFEISLDRLLADSEPSHSLLMIDLDRFKPINDLYGHAAGDALLKELIRGISRLASRDDLVARLGGDEFAMLIAAKPSTIAEKAALDVLQFVSKYRLDWEGQRLSVGASIGMVHIDQPGMSASLVLTASDQALYEAKSAGRGAIFAAEVSPDIEHATGFSRIAGETFEPRPSANSHVPEDGQEQELRARVMANFAQNNDADRRSSHGARNRHRVKHWVSVEPTTVGNRLQPGMLMRELVTDAANRSDGGADFARWVVAMALDGASRLNANTLGHIDFVLPVPARAFIVVPTLADELMRYNALSRLPMRHITFILHGVSAVYRSPELKQMHQRCVASDVRLGYEIRSDNLEVLAPLRHLPFDELHLGRELIKKLRPEPDANPTLDALVGVIKNTHTSLVASCVDTDDELALLTRMGVKRINGAIVGEAKPLHGVLSGLME